MAGEKRPLAGTRDFGPPDALSPLEILNRPQQPLIMIGLLTGRMVRDARCCRAPLHEGSPNLMVRRRESAVSKDVPRDNMHHTSPPSRGALRPRVARTLSLQKRREQGKPGARSTRSRVHW